MKIDFYNSKTKQIHKKLVNTGTYNQFIKDFFKIPFDYGNNDIPDNVTISLRGFTVTELYSRANKKVLRKSFKNFIRFSQKTREQYSRLHDDAKKTVAELINNVDYSYSSWLTDYKLIINRKYVDSISLSLKCIGPSLVRITYNINVTDNARYKFWLLSSPNVNRELRIHTKYRLFKKNYLFSRRTGNEIKVQKLADLEERMCNEINRTIKRIAPGVLSKLYKNVPITLNCSFDYFPSVIITPSYVIPSVQKYTSFWQNLYNISGDHSVRYVDEMTDNIFITPPTKRNIKSQIYMKHFVSSIQSNSGDDLSWICIMQTLLHDQITLYYQIKNLYCEKGISGSNSDFMKIRKEINIIDSIWALIESSFHEDKDFYLSDEIHHSNYSADFGSTNISLINKYIESIDKQLSSIKELLPEIKNIYTERYADKNSHDNTRLQIIALIFTLFTIAQAFYQCSKDVKENDKQKQEIEYNSQICNL